MKTEIPAFGRRQVIDDDSVISEFKTKVPKPDSTPKQRILTKTIKCVFDRSHFLITLTDGVRNKSVGFTRAHLVQLYPKIKEFLHES